MATKRSDNGQTPVMTQEPTLTDILGAVQGVGKRVDGLSNKVDSIDRRVTALEKSPAVKPRMVAPAPSPAPTPQVVYMQAPDDGEDEAIKNGVWEKVIKTSRCYKLGITKTRNRDAWKIKMYLRGQRRPATLIGWDGTAELVEFMREVWAEISDDHFDEEVFAEKDEGRDIPVEFQFDGVHFLVDWFRTSPNARGMTFINVESVFPLADA